MSDNGISFMGGSAEDRFRELTNSLKPSPASLGDAMLNGNFAEVKKVSSDTLNQVRALKYSTLVAFDSREDRWFVVPAVEVVKLVSSKRRGQHSENPFESATISLSKLRVFETDEKDLVSAWEEAIRLSAAYPAIEKKMQEIREECRNLADKHLDEISELFE